MITLQTLELLRQKILHKRLIPLIKIYGKSCLQSFFLDTIDEKEVSSCITSIKANPAPGPDEIPPMFVKAANVIITSFLTKIFSKCIQTETLSGALKIAHVIPIPKVSSP